MSAASWKSSNSSNIFASKKSNIDRDIINHHRSNKSLENYGPTSSNVHAPKTRKYTLASLAVENRELERISASLLKTEKKIKASSQGSLIPTEGEKRSVQINIPKQNRKTPTPRRSSCAFIQRSNLTTLIEK